MNISSAIKEGSKFLKSKFISSSQLDSEILMAKTIDKDRNYILLNSNNLISMPIAMAQGMSNLMGNIYPMFAPTIGAVGAFLAGSNTVSNLMFSQFQFETANLLGLSGALMVAAQSVGAAAGNMVAIHNVVAASATVGLIGREGIILRITVLPTIYYLIASGLINLSLLHLFDVSDPLHNIYFNQ